jgi:hypothetical protein
MTEYFTKNGQALRSKPRIDTRRHLGNPSGTLELGEVSGTSQSKRARGAPGRLRDHDSVGHVGMYGIRLLSRARPPCQDGGEPQDNGRGDGGKAHTAAQKAVQDRLMSGRSPYPGDLLEQLFFDGRNPADRKMNVRSWTSGRIQPGSRRGNGGHGRSSSPCEAEVKNLRSEMRAEAINMGGFTFVLLVGTRDWVARNRVSSSSTLFLDIVSSSKWCTATAPANALALNCPTTEAQA